MQFISPVTSQLRAIMQANSVPCKTYTYYHSTPPFNIPHPTNPTAPSCIPPTFNPSISLDSIQSHTGHTCLHSKHPTHRPSSTSALRVPESKFIAWLAPSLHTIWHNPQPMHLSLSTMETTCFVC